MPRAVYVTICLVLFVVTMAVLGALIRPVTDAHANWMISTFGGWWAAGILFAAWLVLAYFAYRSPKGAKGE